MRRIALIVLVAAAAAGATAVAYAAQSPKALRAAILAAARAQRSVHWDSRQIAGGLLVTSSADVAADFGSQKVTFKIGKQTAHVQILVLETAYVRGDALGLELNLNLTKAQATQYAGQWISIPKGDKIYAPTAQADTLGSLITTITPRGSLKTVKARLRGVRVIGVAGTSGKGKRRKVTTLVAHARGKPLPIEADYVAPAEKILSVITLSKWNENVTVTAPASSTPIATVRG